MDTSQPITTSSLLPALKKAARESTAKAEKARMAAHAAMVDTRDHLLRYMAEREYQTGTAAIQQTADEARLRQGEYLRMQTLETILTAAQKLLSTGEATTPGIQLLIGELQDVATRIRMLDGCS